MVGEMQLAGLMPVEGFVAAAEVHLRRALVKDMEKLDKLSGSPATYKEFVRSWRAQGWMTPEAFDADRERYWQGIWHHQSMEEIFLEYGWATAAEYHKKVMYGWSRGYIDGALEITSHEFRRGNVAGAMHRDSYSDARLNCKASGQGGHGEAGSGPRHMPKGGTKAKVGSDDTRCAEHGCWFPKASNHSWSWDTKSGTCAVAKAKLGKC